MAAKMLVVFVKHTGHVLSAATVASPPVVPPLAADLVGDALTLWGIPASPAWSLALPPDALDVAVIDPKDELLVSPFDWQIGADKQPVQLQYLGQSVTVTPNAGPPQAITLNPPATFTADGVDAVLFEQGGTGPVQVYPGVTAHGIANFQYTGAPVTRALGLITNFPFALK
jgi:hypothetical protein